MSGAYINPKLGYHPRAQAEKSALDEGWAASKAFLKGDYNGPAAIFLDTALGLIPVVGQLIDGRDIVLGVIEVSDDPNQFDAWFLLITALIGVVPGGGDALKRGLRCVKQGGNSADELFALLRKFGHGNPEELIKRAVNLNALTPALKKLTESLRSNRIIDALDAGTKRKVLRTAGQLEARMGGMFKQFDDLVKEILKKQPNTSARPTTQAKGKSKQADKPKNEGDTTSKAKENRTDGKTNRNNMADLAETTFNRMSGAFKGVLGEHLADYWCLEKGWGKGQWQGHDQGTFGKWSAHPLKSNVPGKLNDQGNLTRLWPIPMVRGRGIDGIWRTNKSNGKPYAIIEAKAYANPLTPLSQMLDDVFDKDEYGAWKSAAKDAKGKSGGSSKRSKRTAGAPKNSSAQQTTPDKPGKNTMQMSHVWVKQRIERGEFSRLVKLEILRLGVKDSKNYTRHVVLFGIPHVYEHAVALVKHMQGETVQDSEHAKHDVTREFNDRELDVEEKRRNDKRTAKKGSAK